MASDRPLRAAHVGLSAGHAGSFDDSKPRLIHDVRRLEGVEVVAYCETYDSSFLDEAKKYNPGAGLYSSLDDMLAKEDFDFAAVVLHPADVAPALLKLAEAGKHFMVDKQFARKSEELIPVTKAVLRNNLTTFMLYPWRYHPAALDIRRLIEEDVLGEPVDIESRQFWGQVGGPLGKDINAPAHRLDTEGGGVLHYIGCHHLDLMRAVMGCEVKSVQAMTGRPFGHMEEPMEDIAVLGLEYENGGFGSLHHGYTKPITVGDQGYDSAFVLRGVNGWAEWTPVGGNQLEVTSASPQWRGAPEKTITYDLAPLPSIVGHVWYYVWIEQFANDIRAGRPGRPNMVDGLHVLQSIDAAYESARTGTRVNVRYGVDV